MFGDLSWVFKILKDKKIGEKISEIKNNRRPFVPISKVVEDAMRMNPRPTDEDYKKLLDAIKDSMVFKDVVPSVQMRSNGSDGMTVEQLIYSLLLIQNKKKQIKFSDQYFPLNGEFLEAVFEQGNHVILGI